MYDAIIVGARCAGSATAMLLARKGYRVLLVDKASFPSDTILGHFINYPGVKRLSEWGLLDKVIASNCPPVTHNLSNIGDVILSADIPLIDGNPLDIGPRRIVLDKILLDAAVEAGVEFRERFNVTELVIQNDMVIGIRGSTEKQQPITEYGKIVIGADGKHSIVARMVKAPTYREIPPLCCWYYSYWSNFPTKGLELHWQHHRCVIIFPTNDNLACITIGWRHNEFHEFRSNIEGNFLQTMALFPTLKDRIENAKREERFYGVADLPNFFRKPYGAGWALVGDAGYHKDPLTGTGISDAFRDAELLSELLDQGFSGQKELETALIEYEQRRNERAIPEYEVTCFLAQLEGWDAPEAMRLRSALQTNEVERINYFKVMAKALPSHEFYAPENIQRIINEATTAS